MKDIKAFCERFGITEDQFYGREVIKGNLSLSYNQLTSLPEGFNPTVSGDLWLHNNQLTSLPEGFNPTVGGGLYLDNNQLTSLPEGFNPTVGGGLWLHSNKSKLSANVNRMPENFVFTWQNGKYIKVDGIMTEVISKRGGVYRVKRIGKKEISYLVTDGERWAHGETLKEAKADLIFKVSNRTTEDYKGMKLTDTVTFEEGIIAYRVITGACSFGVKDFVNNRLGKKKAKYKISEIIELTKNEYGGRQFKSFFV